MKSLTRPPRGFDKDQECIEDIKRKSFIAVKEMDVGELPQPAASSSRSRHRSRLPETT